MSVKNKCCFSTDITEELSCSPTGDFDDYGFPVEPCKLFPCQRYKEIKQKCMDKPPEPKGCSNCGRTEIDDDACMDCIASNFNRHIPKTTEKV